jgi:hypothetical protein
LLKYLIVAHKLLHYNRQKMESVILQFPELLIIYLSLIFLAVTNFDNREHPSNIKMDYLNITKLRMGINLM